MDVKKVKKLKEENYIQDKTTYRDLFNKPKKNNSLSFLYDIIRKPNDE